MGPRQNRAAIVRPVTGLAWTRATPLYLTSVAANPGLSNGVHTVGAPAGCVWLGPVTAGTLDHDSVVPLQSDALLVVVTM